MNKLLSTLLALVISTHLAFADGEVDGVFSKASSGTTSATVFVGPHSDFTQITDLSWRLDATVTTGLIFIRSGDVEYAVSSATSGSGTVVWFANASTAVAAGEYIIIWDASTGDYLLRCVGVSPSATSVTVTESISIALATADKVWSIEGNYGRPVVNAATSTTGNSSSLIGGIWLPRNKPTAITVDGNTTACRIYVNGMRTMHR